MSKKKHKFRGFAAIVLLAGGIALVKTSGCSRLDITKVIETVTPDTPTPTVTGEVTPTPTPTVTGDVTPTPAGNVTPIPERIYPDDKVYNGLSANDMLKTGQTEKYSCDVIGEPYEVRIFDKYEHIIHVYVAKGESYSETAHEVFESYDTAGSGYHYMTLEGTYFTWINNCPVITIANENGEFINMGFEYCPDDPVWSEIVMNKLQRLYGPNAYQKTK